MHSQMDALKARVADGETQQAGWSESTGWQMNEETERGA